MTKISFVVPKDELYFEDKVKFEEVPSHTFFMYNGTLYLKDINKFTGQIKLVDMDVLSVIDSEFVTVFDCEEVQPITVLKIKAI